jgi:hypothetical protein
MERWLNHIRKWKTFDTQNNLCTLDLGEEDNLDDWKITRQIQPGGQNRSFIGLTLWPEEEKGYEVLKMLK